MGKIKKSDTIKRRGVLVPASLSTEFVLGQPVEGVQERRPLNSLAELYHAFTLRAVTGNVTMSASKSFGCLFESLSFHSFLLSNAFKVRPKAYASTSILPLVYFCPCLRTKIGIGGLEMT